MRSLASKLRTRLLVLSGLYPQQFTQNLASRTLGNNIQDLDAPPEPLVVGNAFSDPFRNGFLDVLFLLRRGRKGDW